MERDSNVRVITLSDLWKIFVNRLWIIILAVVIMVSGVYIFNTVTYEAEYESVATLYILKQNDKESSDSTSSDFTLALNVVNDCDYLLRSHAVLDEVIRDLNLDMTYDELYNNVSTSNPENTRILEVKVHNNSPELSKQIVDSVCEIGAEKIKLAMGFQQVNLYEYGIMDETPSNKVGAMFYIFVAIIVFVLLYFVFLLIFLLDDRLVTDEDINKQLDLQVIGDIPDSNGPRNGKSRYKYYGKIQETVKESEGL